jgi:hypothetical protein
VSWTHNGCLLSCCCFKSCVVAFCSTETTQSHRDLMDKTLTLVVASYCSSRRSVFCLFCECKFFTRVKLMAFSGIQ